MLAYACNSISLRQEDCKFKAHLAYRVKPYLEIFNSQKTHESIGINQNHNETSFHRAEEATLNISTRLLVYRNTYPLYIAFFFIQKAGNWG